MKTTTLLISSLALVAILATGCSKQDRTKANSAVQDAYADTKTAAQNAYNDAKTTVKDVYNDTRTSLSEGWDNVRSYSFDKKSDFEKSAHAMGSRVDSEISQLQANYAGAKASASRKLAMDELKNSQADYKQKLDALGTATADTWESAKQNVIAAWDRMQAAYHKARE
jgi:hypothetical protein